MPDNGTTRWLDMGAHGLTLAVCDMGDIRLLAATGNPSADDAAQLEQSGFVSAGDDLWVREGDTVDLEALVAAFPQSRPVQVSVTEFSSRFVIRQAEAAKRENRRSREERDDERRRLLSDLLSGSRKLGVNHVGQEVWAYEDDKRFCLQREGKTNFSILSEEEREGINPGLFLRGVSPAAEAQAVEGFVEGMAAGENRRYDELRRFAGVVYGNGEAVAPDDERLIHIDSLIEGAMIRWLARRNTRSGREIFHGAQRLQEARAYRTELSGNPGFRDILPLPVSVAMQRIAGTEGELRGRSVLASGWPSLGAFVPAVASLHARSHDEATLNAVMTAARRASALKSAEGDTPVIPFAVLFSEPASVSAEPAVIDGFTIRRADIAAAFTGLSEREAEGHTVMAFEAPRNTDEEREFAEFHYRTAQKYAIEGVARVRGALTVRNGAGWYLFSVGRLRPEMQAEPPAAAMKITDITEYTDLWTWTSSIAVTRAAIGNYFGAEQEQEQDKDDEPADMQVNKYQSPYVSLSSLGTATTMVPRNLEAATRKAHDNLRLAHPDFDTWICNQLGMTKENAATVLSPEQIDAAGMTLHAFERNRAALIGDQTGLGKGRAMAAVMRWAILQGKKVIFVTEKTLGFGEIARDFMDIGAFGDLAPFVMNANVNIRDENADVQPGEEKPSILVSTERDAVLDVMRSGRFPDRSNIVFMTFSQVNQAGEPKQKKKKRANKKEDAKKQRAEERAAAAAAVQAQAEVQADAAIAAEAAAAGEIPEDELFGFQPEMDMGAEQAVDDDADETDEVEADIPAAGETDDNEEPDEGDEILPQGVSAKSWWLRHAVDKDTVLVLDESHNASGTKSNIGGNVHAAIQAAGNVLFCSATYAKNARTMEIYAPLLPADFDSSNISQIINRGGDDMHAIFSSMLVEDGVMAARQHDLSNCKFIPMFDDKYSERNKDYLGRLAPILSEMSYMSGDIGRRLNSLNRRTTLELMDKFKHNEGAVQKKMRTMGLRTVAFGSPLYQITKLCVASLLVDSTVDGWIKALEEGRKPMVFTENTIQGLMTSVQAEGGGRLPDFRDLMHRVLNQLCKVTRSGRKKGEVVEVQNPFEASDEEQMADRLAATVRASMSEFLLSDPDPNEAIPADTAPDGRALSPDEMAPWKAELYAAVITGADRIAAADGINLAEDAAPRSAILLAAMDEVRDLIDSLHLVRSDNVEVLRAFPDYLPPTPARTKRRIGNMIDRLPALPASAIDEIRERVEAEGLKRFENGQIERPWVVGEITGRNLEVRNGEIVTRHKPSRFEIRNDFNNGAIDGLILNAAGATSVSLHAGARCRDQRQREMWMLQQHGDIMKFIQAIGRIYRFDQVIGPIIVTPMLAMPAHERLLAMQNVKLRRLSANMQSSVEHPAATEDIADLMNSIGDGVVASWSEDHQDILRRMGLELRDLTNAGDDVADKDNESRDNDYIAHKFLARLILLPPDLQTSVLEDIKVLYKATLQELNDKGENPLETRVIHGNVLVRSSSVYQGHDTEGGNSVFHQPVMLNKVVIEHAQDPLRSPDVGEKIDAGLASYTMQGIHNLPAHLRANRENFLRKSLMPGETLEDALARGGAAAGVIRRFDNLLESLPKCAPGMVIKTVHEGMPARAVITAVYAPKGEEEEVYFSDVHDKKKQKTQSEFMAANYVVKFAMPGTFAVSERRLSSLLNEPGFEFVGHLNEEIAGLPLVDEADIMNEFDTALEGMRISPRMMLVGNDWAAMQSMLEHKLGYPVVYRDDNGNLHRAVMVTKRAEALDFLPIRMSGAENGTLMASELLSEGNVKLYGVRAVGGKKNMEKGDGLIAVWSKKKKMMKISLPHETDSRHGWIMKIPAIRVLVDEAAEEDSLTKTGLWKYKKMCMWVPKEEIKAVLRVFVDNGITFYAPPSCGKIVNAWKAERAQMPDEAEEPEMPDAEEIPDGEDPMLQLAAA